MHVTQTAEYALRAMAWLVGQGVGASVRAQDMAHATRIPLPYLSKILRRLVVARLLVSQKGHHGGFSLARSGREIRFEDVLKACDYEPDPDACAFGWDNCDPVHPCPLHPAWAELKRAYSDWAERTTLADLATVTMTDPVQGTLRTRASRTAGTRRKRLATPSAAARRQRAPG